MKKQHNQPYRAVQVETNGENLRVAFHTLSEALHQGDQIAQGDSRILYARRMSPIAPIERAIAT
jgi:hypothetical protein